MYPFSVDQSTQLNYMNKKSTAGQIIIQHY